MNLCDTTIWLALVLSRHIHHAAARSWLQSIDEPASVFFCRSTQQSFLRLLTNASVLGAYGNPPLTNGEAWATYEALLRDDRIVLREEPANLEPRWQQIVTRGTATPKLWMDAYLAAYALTGGCRMVTTDVGFRQFRGLHVVLVGSTT